MNHAERDALLDHGMRINTLLTELRAEQKRALDDHSYHAAPSWRLFDVAAELLSLWLAQVRAEIKLDIASELYAAEARCRASDAAEEMYVTALNAPGGELLDAELERKYPHVRPVARRFAERPEPPSAA